MHIAVDQEACVGAGQCVLSAPEVFDQDDESGLVVLLDEQPPEELHRDVREAVKLCPVQALAATED
ncbi:ferredoxin [Streptomyces sp. P1-3]|uniref:ferredoxin n=1 Tax=Streptomyces sp. P1-3 TaxID=3421658 RepID=UPI003D36EA02